MLLFLILFFSNLFNICLVSVIVVGNSKFSVDLYECIDWLMCIIKFGSKKMNEVLGFFGYLNWVIVYYCAFTTPSATQLFITKIRYITDRPNHHTNLLLAHILLSNFSLKLLFKLWVVVRKVFYVGLKGLHLSLLFIQYVLHLIQLFFFYHFGNFHLFLKTLFLIIYIKKYQ